MGFGWPLAGAEIAEAHKTGLTRNDGTVLSLASLRLWGPFFGWLITRVQTPGGNTHVLFIRQVKKAR